MVSIKSLIVCLLLLGTLLGACGPTQSISDQLPNENARNPLKLSYIWSFEGLESGQVIMALNQSGNNLYGVAKYEPDRGRPWNGMIVGSIHEDSVNMVLTPLENGNTTSIKLSGVYSEINQSIRGEFFQVSNGNISKKGPFNAIWINPDTSCFIRAIVKPNEPANTISVSQAINRTSQETVQKKSRYYDVRQDANSIMTGICPIGIV